MNKLSIIGAGFSTAVLCHYLQNKDVHIFEKSRGPGGRSSTRKVDDIGVFDHGLQYISPKTEEFSKFISSIKGIKKWQGDFVELNGKEKLLPKSEKLIGEHGNNDFAKNLIDINKCKFKSKIEKIEFHKDHWKLIDDGQSEYRTQNLILTLPQEQTYSLIKNLDLNFKIEKNIMKPCFTVMLALKKTSIFKYSGYIIKNNAIISWCAHESSKQRSINNNELTQLTIQTTEEYGYANFKKYRENKDEILNEILETFLHMFKIDSSEVVHKNVHGWLYAYAERNDLPVFWDNQLRLGITGDWFTGGKAENSWQNAKLLADIINN